MLLEGLAELGAHAEQAGAVLLLEPLNRYEDHMVNTVAQRRRAHRARPALPACASSPTPTT